MKIILLNISILLNVFTTFSTDKTILTTVIFENLTQEKDILGEFNILETNTKINVASFDSFEFILPKKGKYTFYFKTKRFIVNIVYPKRISKSNNLIKIQISEPITSNELSTSLSDKQIEYRISKGLVNFISFGISSIIPNEYNLFKEKYGIGLTIKNCAIDKQILDLAKTNNHIIAEYLNRKLNENWKLDLITKPIGID